MQIKALQFKKEDKTEVAIYVYFCDMIDKEWRIDDIRYREFRKRNWVSLSESFADSYDYCILSMCDRKIYKLKKYIDFVGVDRLKEAIMNAWEQLKPDVENMFSDISKIG